MARDIFRHHWQLHRAQDKINKEVEAFMAIEDQIQTGLEYEDRVIEIPRSFGQKLLRGSSEVERRGKNSKKN